MTKIIDMKKVFVYANYSDEILNPDSKFMAIGGAEVQLAFWSKALGEVAKVYSFSYAFSRFFRKRREWGIRFCFVPFIRKVNALLFYIKPLWLVFIRPDYLVMKAVTQEIGFILKLKKRLGFKLVYFMASDNDVEEDGTMRKKRMFTAIKNADYVVAQNEFQEIKVKEVLGAKNVIQLGNIWDKSVFRDASNNKQYDYVWVAKFNENKRPEWFVDLARRNPNLKFAMVGPCKSKKKYTHLLEEIEGLQNLNYLGFKFLIDATEIVSQSRCLVCTSIYEGFPNTFLQAFSYSIPVLSTVNPSNIILKYHLGCVYETLEEAIEFIRDDGPSKVNPKAIQCYFEENHNPVTLRNKLANFIQMEI